ncbi:hypothetical protein F8M41_023326 [Gigaspora margarita]|uniref:Uncharacterized protein n=1 Tax=Gigaspora margarita TaxID=4874 RepID=A0A8H4ADM7_GIGMA|nr:hypothetical protein F8M41_023326 [Gigaspora margarita]
MRCSYYGVRDYIVNNCLQVTYLNETCTALFGVLTKEQAAKAQKIINEVFGNCKLNNKQFLKLLNLLSTNCKDLYLVDSTSKILSAKPLHNKSSIPEVVDNNVVLEEPTHNVGFGFEEEGFDLFFFTKILLAKSKLLYNEIIEAGRKEESSVKKDKKDDKPNENDNGEYDDDKMIVDEKDSEKDKDVTKPT